MSDSSSETETRITPRSGKCPSSAEEDSSAGQASGGVSLKKGPWTSTEDAILIDYVNKHGEGNWNAVQKYSGLSRCGKSCRLRWANHLRPDLKKGAFTLEEESRIIEFHAKMGNKWARMATELPGRTDNEIKNFWNTRIKRLQRAGLPIYPPEICAQSVNESQEVASGKICSESSEMNAFDIPAIEFRGLGPAQGGYMNCASSLDFLFPKHPHKRLRPTETIFPSAVGSINNGFASFGQHTYDANARYSQPLWSPSYDLNVHNAPLLDRFPGNPALTNGNPSSSEPIPVATKLELPSLQYSASQVGSGAPLSPLPSLESVDTFIQSPLSEQTQSDCPSPRSSGLLEAIVYESKSLKNNSFSHISDASTVFMEHRAISASSSDEPQSAETLQGFNGKAEMGDLVSADSDGGGRKDYPLQPEELRPDVLLDSCWFGHKRGFVTDQSISADQGTRADDQNCEYMTANIPELSQISVLRSSAWENESDLFQF